MKATAHELIFISLIKRDGSGVITKDITPSNENEIYNLYTLEVYKITPLSLTKETFIAHGFNSFVVKLKK